MILGDRFRLQLIEQNLTSSYPDIESKGEQRQMEWRANGNAADTGIIISGDLQVLLPE
jgi:hypothetical protein